ncbi:MAG: rubrerythrin family protein [Pseudomonadales bacterium]|jgi:rubrerythrin|nr:rubrerythrin family protein [Pseudomonadales bacterium]
MDRTYQNLATAFIGESMARNRYSIYASIARKAGYEQIAAIFLETADQEKEHASKLFAWMSELAQKPDNAGKIVIENVEVENVRGTTEENLRSAIHGEGHEHTEMYPEFARVAAEEGYTDISKHLIAIAQAENHHQQRYQKILEVLEKGETFQKSEDVWWCCRECGYMLFNKSAPDKCPACSHPQAYYQLRQEVF